MTPEQIAERIVNGGDGRRIVVDSEVLAGEITAALREAEERGRKRGLEEERATPREFEPLGAFAAAATIRELRAEVARLKEALARAEKAHCGKPVKVVKRRVVQASGSPTLPVSVIPEPEAWIESHPCVRESGHEGRCEAETARATASHPAAK